MFKRNEQKPKEVVDDCDFRLNETTPGVLTLAYAIVLNCLFNANPEAAEVRFAHEQIEDDSLLLLPSSPTASC